MGFKVNHLYGISCIDAHNFGDLGRCSMTVPHSNSLHCVRVSDQLCLHPDSPLLS